jgi:hypothetical protein
MASTSSRSTGDPHHARTGADMHANYKETSRGGLAVAFVEA